MRPVRKCTLSVQRLELEQQLSSFSGQLSSFSEKLSWFDDDCSNQLKSSADSLAGAAGKLSASSDDAGEQPAFIHLRPFIHSLPSIVGPALGWQSVRRLCCVQQCAVAGAQSHKARNGGFVRFSAGSLQVGSSRGSRRFAIDGFYWQSKELACEVAMWREQHNAGYPCALTLVSFGNGACRSGAALVKALPEQFWLEPTYVAGVFLEPGLSTPSDIWQPHERVADDLEDHPGLICRNAAALGSVLHTLLHSSRTVSALLLTFSWASSPGRISLLCLESPNQLDGRLDIAVSKNAKQVPTPLRTRSVPQPASGAVKQMLAHCEASFAGASPECWLLGCIRGEGDAADLQVAERVAHGRPKPVPQDTPSLPPTPSRQTYPKEAAEAFIAAFNAGKNEIRSQPSSPCKRHADESLPSDVDGQMAVPRLLSLPSLGLNIISGFHVGKESETFNEVTIQMESQVASAHQTTSPKEASGMVGGVMQCHNVPSTTCPPQSAIPHVSNACNEDMILVESHGVSAHQRNCANEWSRGMMQCHRVPLAPSLPRSPVHHDSEACNEDTILSIVVQTQMASPDQRLQDELVVCDGGGEEESFRLASLGVRIIGASPPASPTRRHLDMAAEACNADGIAADSQAAYPDYRCAGESLAAFSEGREGAAPIAKALPSLGLLIVSPPASPSRRPVGEVAEACHADRIVAELQAASPHHKRAGSAVAHDGGREKSVPLAAFLQGRHEDQIEEGCVEDTVLSMPAESQPASRDQRLEDECLRIIAASLPASPSRRHVDKAAKACNVDIIEAVSQGLADFPHQRRAVTAVALNEGTTVALRKMAARDKAVDSSNDGTNAEESKVVSPHQICPDNLRSADCSKGGEKARPFVASLPRRYSDCPVDTCIEDTILSIAVESQPPSPHEALAGESTALFEGGEEAAPEAKALPSLGPLIISPPASPSWRPEDKVAEACSLVRQSLERSPHRRQVSGAKEDGGQRRVSEVSEDKQNGGRRRVSEGNGSRQDMERWRRILAREAAKYRDSSESSRASGGEDGHSD